MPSEKMSVRWSSSWPRACSGLTYQTEPSTWPVAVRLESWPWRLAAAVEGQVAGLVDRAHAAGADDAHEPVGAADLLPDQRVGAGDDRLLGRQLGHASGALLVRSEALVAVGPAAPPRLYRTLARQG